MRRWLEALPWGLLGLVGFSALTSAVVVNLGGETVTIREGQTIPRAIPARVGFKIEDPRKTLQMRLRARDSSPNYYRLNTALLDEIRARLKNALTLAKAHSDDPETLKREAAKNQIRLDDAGAKELIRLATSDDPKVYEQAIDALIARLRTQPVVEPSPAGIRRTTTVAILFDPAKSQERRLAMSQLHLATRPEVVEKVLDDVLVSLLEPLRASIKHSLMAMLAREDGAVRAWYVYDVARTEEVAARAEQSVPPQYLVYNAGDLLADAGVVTDDELELLRAEHQAWLAQRAKQPWSVRLRPIAGRTLLALLVVGGVALYLARERQTRFLRSVRGVAATLALLALLALARAVFVRMDVPAHAVSGIQALGAALLGIVFPHAAVFVVCSGLAVLISIAVHQQVPFLLLLVSISGVLVFGLREVRYRGRIVLIGGLAALAAAIITGSIGLMQSQTMRFTLTLCAWTAGSTLMAAFIVEGILPAIERIFHVSTAMTLLEWCDASRPLLRMLAAEAPGTYNHSLNVGTLAEAAADAIGANGLLARAGAYYHDIGKINKPEYFVENQAGGDNPHTKLNPAMSLLIIVGHVKDGLEMAREYGLPRPLRAFIAEHHGTTLVEFFYHAANQQRKPGEPEIPDNEFRYPGPKPQSRETAIVMIADAVEGAVRAMSDPTPNRIESVVRDITYRRLVDGQFDDCDLTFRELAQIEKSLVRTLCGIYHARVAYPESQKGRKAV